MVDAGSYVTKSTVYIIQNSVQYVYLTVNSEYFRECKPELFPRFCFCQFFHGSEKLLTKNCTVKKAT